MMRRQSMSESLDVPPSVPFIRMRISHTNKELVLMRRFAKLVNGATTRDRPALYGIRQDRMLDT